MSENKMELRKQARDDSKALLRLYKTNKKTKIDVKDLFELLKVHFWNMCSDGNYQFPPTNFDNGMTQIFNEKAPRTPSVGEAPPENPSIRNFFNKHPVYSQRLITTILRAGLIDSTDECHITMPANSDDEDVDKEIPIDDENIDDENSDQDIPIDQT